MGTLRPGTRVFAKHQPGTVKYVRMAPPNYNEPAAYSVVLDTKALKPGYSVTIFAAKDVSQMTTDAALMADAAR